MTYIVPTTEQKSDAMKAGIRRHCIICGMQPSELTAREVKDIAELASVPRQFAFDYMNAWHWSSLG